MDAESRRDGAARKLPDERRRYAAGHTGFACIRDGRFGLSSIVPRNKNSAGCPFRESGRQTSGFGPTVICALIPRSNEFGAGQGGLKPKPKIGRIRADVPANRIHDQFLSSAPHRFRHLAVPGIHPILIIAQALAAESDYPGFLPTRGSFMLDFLLVALIAIVILMALSIWLVRARRQFVWHKRIQVFSAALLAVTIVAFEIDMRFVTDWRQLAAASPWYESGVVDGALAIHLMFAIPTPLIWVYTLVQALRRMPNPPRPGADSVRHRFWGWLSVIFLSLTAVTGWCFYVIAFVA